MEDFVAGAFVIALLICCCVGAGTIIYSLFAEWGPLHRWHRERRKDTTRDQFVRAILTNLSQHPENWKMVANPNGIYGEHIHRIDDQVVISGFGEPGDLRVSVGAIGHFNSISFKPSLAKKLVAVCLEFKNQQALDYISKPLLEVN